MQKNRYAFDLIYWKPAIILLFSVVVIIIGFLISDIPRMIVSQGWPTTGGTILSNRFSGVTIKEYDGDVYTTSGVYIRYEYSVDGISYESLSINSIDTPFYPSSYANRYPVGKNIIVYYNPNNPAEAVLEPGFVDILKAFGGFSGLFFVLGIFFIIIGVLDIKKIRYQNYVKGLMEKYRLNK